MRDTKIQPANLTATRDLGTHPDLNDSLGLNRDSVAAARDNRHPRDTMNLIGNILKGPKSDSIIQALVQLQAKYTEKKSELDRN